MAIFTIGETITLTAEVRNASGVLINPSTSMTVTISHSGIADVTDQAMTNDSTGHYHYDFQTAGKTAEKYAAVYKATDGTTIGITKNDFDLAP